MAGISADGGDAGHDLAHEDRPWKCDADGAAPGMGDFDGLQLGIDFSDLPTDMA